jgi:dienelactone hydrolase
MRYLSITLLTFLFGSALFAQKKTLTEDDYGKFQLMGYPSLAKDGNWSAYAVITTTFDDSAFFKNLSSGKEYAFGKAMSPQVAPLGNWGAYITTVSFTEKEKLTESKKPVPRGVAIVDLSTGNKSEIKDANSFRFSDNGKFIVIELDAQKEKSPNKVILLRNLSTGETRTIGNVKEYAFNKKGDFLAYIVGGENTYANTIELFDLRSYATKVINSDTLGYSSLTWSPNGESLAFYKELKDTLYEDKEKAASVHYYSGIYKTPVLYSYTAAQLKPGFRILPASRIMISEDLQIVYFGIKEWTKKPEKKSPAKDTAAKDSAKTAAPAAPKKENVADVDVWHWKDKDIQPYQKLMQNTIANAHYLVSWVPAQSKAFQLTEKLTDRAMSNFEKNAVVVQSDEKYKPAMVEDFADVYYVDALTGNKVSVAEKLDLTRRGLAITRLGKYIIYFKDKHWWSFNTQTKKVTNITEKINEPVWDTRDDHPGPLFYFGASMFSKDEETVFINTEYDVYSVRLDGKSQQRLTKGKEEGNIYRVYAQFSNKSYYDPALPIYFRKFGDLTKKAGLVSYQNGKFDELFFEDILFGNVVKAEDANMFLISKETNQTPIALYSGTSLKALKSIHQSNKFASEYANGKVELINYTNKNGKKLQGTLYYPVNYTPGKQYPLVVYIYEKLSDGINRFPMPSPTSAYNTVNFTNAGYFIFQPDIVYDMNDPGISAVNCVVPAVEEVLKTGMVNKDQLGIMGHSWGAYQTSFIVTQTDLFKAGVAGAPLTNMISMSLSIYWNSGVPDQKIFETSQGRFDGPWYERMEEHMRNSPIYAAKNLKTPLLVAFGDKDGAVDWHQGIELYGTLRRMQKPHVLLVYANENHGLAKKENRIDYMNRQRQWFDHFLLKKEAPKWIEEGMTYDERVKFEEKNKK